VTAAALLTVVAVLGVWGLWRHGASAPAPGPLAGTIDVRVWDPDDPARRNLSLFDSGAMPLQAGDLVGVRAEVNRPAYLYVIWIDSEGTAQPVYPWVPGRWERPAAAERPVERLDLPRDTGGSAQGWPMRGPAGMETLLLLARDTPIPPSLNLRDSLAGLPRPARQDPLAVARFADWEFVQVGGGADRGPDLLDPKRLGDPVLQAEALLRVRLGPHFALMRAVTFANRGD
jgi:hypothetical protein